MVDKFRSFVENLVSSQSSSSFLDARKVFNCKLNVCTYTQVFQVQRENSLQSLIDMSVRRHKLSARRTKISDYIFPEQSWKIMEINLISTNIFWSCKVHNFDVVHLMERLVAMSPCISLVLCYFAKSALAGGSEAVFRAFKKEKSK